MQITKFKLNGDTFELSTRRVNNAAEWIYYITSILKKHFISRAVITRSIIYTES